MHGNPSSPSTSSQSASDRALRIGMIVLTALVFLASRWYILFQFEPLHTDVRDNYFQYAARVFDLHQVPYQKDFKIEYPPVAWWTIYAPRVLDSRRISDPRDANQVMPVYKAYRRAFRGLMFSFDLASLLLLALIVHSRQPGWAEWAALGYAVTTAILGYVLYDRLDVGLALLLLMWAYCWIRSLDESGHTIAWTAAAYTILGLSIGYKLIPVIAVPFLLVAEWNAPRRQVRLAAALGALTAAACLPFVIQYAISGPGLFTLFDYHSERGIEVESLYSTLMMIFSLLGHSIFVQFSHGAFELSGVLASDMKTLSNILLLGFFLAMGAWALWQGSRYRRLQAYCTALFVICSAVGLAKVLSPQYFLWAIPMALLLAVEILPNRGWSRWILLAVLIAVAGLTTWLYPSHYLRRTVSEQGLVPIGSMNPWELATLPCVMLGLRNLSYLGVMVWLGVMLFRRGASGVGRKIDRQ